jgi:hypothetical protein
LIMIMRVVANARWRRSSVRDRPPRSTEAKPKRDRGSSSGQQPALQREQKGKGLLGA